MDVIPATDLPQTKEEFQSDIARNRINSSLTRALVPTFLTPYIALERVRKVLSPFHIFIPKHTFSDLEADIAVFDADQFGLESGIDDSGNIIENEPSGLYIYFEYSMEDDGTYSVFCEIVNDEELDELIDFEPETTSIDPEDYHEINHKEHLGGLNESLHPQDVKIPYSNFKTPRSEMPQISSKNIPDFLNTLKKKGIKCKEENIRIDNLKPSQGEFNREKLANQINNKETIDKHIIVSKDDYVLDGHHNWLTRYNIDPKSKMKAYKVDLPIKTLMKYAKDYSGSERKDVTGRILAEMSRGRLSDYIQRAQKDYHNTAQKAGEKMIDGIDSSNELKNLKKRLSGIRMASKKKSPEDLGI